MSIKCLQNVARKVIIRVWKTIKLWKSHNKCFSFREETGMKKDGKYSATQIAEWFLYYNRIMMTDYDAEYISNLKLQKLLYYAQGCYTALRDNVLFNDPIVAWAHGPVVEEVYQKYKSNKANGINYSKTFDIEIDKDTETILKEVYDAFGKYSAWGLRNMTHSETPWKETNQNDEIDINSIKKYFKENYIS